MKKYTTQDIVKNLQGIKFPNITYNKRHEIMSNVVIEIAKHQYLCIGRCGNNVGYRFLYRNGNNKQLYSKQRIIHFGNEDCLNRIGIFDATPNNILLVAAFLLTGWQCRLPLFKEGLEVQNLINRTETLNLANYIALNAKVKITDRETQSRYQTLDNALWKSYNLKMYYSIKDTAAAFLGERLYTGVDDKFIYAPANALHAASWYLKRTKQTKLKL